MIIEIKYSLTFQSWVILIDGLAFARFETQEAAEEYVAENLTCYE